MESKRSRNGGRPLRTGFVGAGFIADIHARVIAKIPGATLVGVFDLDRDRATELARRHGIPRVCDSVDQLLDEIDVIHVLAPPPMHAKLAIAGVERGLDVLIEKPIAISSAECAKIASVAKSSRSRIGVNHNTTYSPAFREAVEKLRKWQFGELQHVTAVVNVGLRQLRKGEHHHWMFRSQENLLLEQLPHPLSLILSLLGPVKQVSALPSGAVTLNTGAILFDTWQISLICERGSAQCFLSLGRECNDAWLHLIGQDGTAFVDLHRNILRVTEKSRFIEPMDFFLDSSRNSWRTAIRALTNLTDYGMGFVGAKPPGDPVFKGMLASITDFYESLRSGRQVSSGLGEGTAVIEAIEEIASIAKPVLAGEQTTRRAYV